MTPEDPLHASAQPSSSPPNDDVGDVDVVRVAWGSSSRAELARGTGPSKPATSRIAVRDGTSADTHSAPEGDET